MLLQYTPKEFRNDPLLNELPSPKAKLAAFLCAWSDEDRSENIYIKKNRLTMHRNPVPRSTDVMRGKVGFSSSEHYWLIIWHGPKFGSSAVVGVATKKSVLHGEGYYSLLGSDHESWGWDLSEGVLHYNGKVIRNYPQPEHITKVSLYCTLVPRSCFNGSIYTWQLQCRLSPVLQTLQDETRTTVDC